MCVTLQSVQTLRYIQHKTDFETLPSTRPIHIPCRVNGCKCKSYVYIPKNGSQPIRCRCKHYATDHSEATSHKCLKGCGCQEFISSFTCGCGQPTYTHKVKCCIDQNSLECFIVQSARTHVVHKILIYSNGLQAPNFSKSLPLPLLVVKVHVEQFWPWL